MTEIPSSHHDLLEADVATLATIGPDGLPQLSEVWFLNGDDGVSVSLNTTRQKFKNLMRQPSCSLLILDLANPFRYLELRGNAEILPDDDFAFAKRVGEKYHADLSQYDPPGATRVQVRINPVRVHAVDMSG